MVREPTESVTARAVSVTVVEPDPVPLSEPGPDPEDVPPPGLEPCEELFAGPHPDRTADIKTASTIPLRALRLTSEPLKRGGFFDISDLQTQGLVQKFPTCGRNMRLRSLRR
jgi:hypothetical protein